MLSTLEGNTEYFVLLVCIMQKKSTQSVEQKKCFVIG